MNPLTESRSGGWPPAAAAISLVAKLSFSGANSTEMLGYLAWRLETISPPTSLLNGNRGLPNTASLALIVAAGRVAPSPPAPQATTAPCATAADAPATTVRRVSRISRVRRQLATRALPIDDLDMIASFENEVPNAYHWLGGL